MACYSDCTVVQNAISQFSIVNPLSGLLAYVKDDRITRNRPLIIVSEQVIAGRDSAQECAQWEKAHRIGRSQALRLTCDSWRSTRHRTSSWARTGSSALWCSARVRIARTLI
jgi:prophage tail gpP-like protein